MALSEVITNYRTRRPQIAAILKNEDQAALEADLTAFFGTNAVPYLRHAASLAAHDKLLLPSWHWPFFLTLGYGWACYRRLYAAAAALYGAQFLTAIIGTNPRLVGVALVFMGFYLLGLIALTLFAKSLYVGFALNAIARANERRIVAHKRGEYIAKAGGTSLISGVCGVALLLVNILLIAVAASMPPT